MSLEVLLRISVLHAELLALARDLSFEERRIVAYSANVLRLLNNIPIDGIDEALENDLPTRSP